MSKSESHSVRLNVPMSPAMLARINRAARAQGQKMAAFARQILEREIRLRKMLSATPPAPTKATAKKMPTPTELTKAVAKAAAAIEVTSKKSRRSVRARQQSLALEAAEGPSHGG